MEFIAHGVRPWEISANIVTERLATSQAAAIAAFEATDPAYSVVTVTSLADSGTGTLRAALTSSGNALIKFSVGGTITLASEINILSDGIKIVCGETAPTPGITIRGRFNVRVTAPVTFRHVRRIIDPGGGGYGNRDGFEFINSNASAWDFDIENCGLINCSVYHGTDETISFFVNRNFPLLETHDIFVRNSIVAEGIWNLDIRPEDSPHRNGLLIGSPDEPGVPVHNAWVHNNLFHSNRERNPRWGSGTTGGAVNNLITNSGRYWCDFGNDGTARPTQVSYVGNYIQRGAEPETFRTPFDQDLPASSEIYWDDNYVNGTLTSLDDADVNNVLTFDPSVGSPPVSYPSWITPINAQRVPWTVLTTAGACPWFYNHKDLRVIREAARGTGIMGEGGNIGDGTTLMETFWPEGPDE